MPRKYNIDIPQPCSQNWDDMTYTADGKYCLSCQSNVFDFTGKTDQEIVEALKKSKGHLCGRFETDQLKRTLYTEPYFRFPMRAGVARALLALAAAYPLVTKASNTCELPVAVSFYGEQPSASVPPNETVTADSVAYVLKGYVMNTSNVRLSKAKVLLDGTEIYVETNSNGYFEIHFNAPADQEEFTFDILCSGYSNLRQTVSKQDLLAEKKVKFLLSQYQRIVGRVRSLDSRISW